MHFSQLGDLNHTIFCQLTNLDLPAYWRSKRYSSCRTFHLFHFILFVQVKDVVQWKQNLWTLFMCYNILGLTMYTEDEEKEFLYPNSSYCEYLKTWWKYSRSFEGVKFIEGFHDRQKRICEALKLNYDHKSTVAIHLRDIVVAMMVSWHYLMIITV